jgi:hypothetical protein
MISSVSIAVWVHLLAALAFHRAPLLGAGEFSSAVAGLAGRKELAPAKRPEPLKVALGEAERVPHEGPGPRARLDPAAVRRPPGLGPPLPDERLRVALARPLFDAPEREVTAALRVLPPGSATLAWADEEVSGASIDLASRKVVRTLPPRFLPRASLRSAARRARLAPDPTRASQSLALDPAPRPAVRPESWPEPPRALRVPEVFIDVLDAGQP